MNKSHMTTLGIPYWNADGTAVHFLDDEGFVGIGSKSLDRLQYMPISTGITETILRFEKGFEAGVVLEPGKMLFTSLAGTLHRLEKTNGQWGETLVGNVNWDACCLAYAPEHDHVAIMSPHELVIFSAADTTRMVIVKFESLDDLGFPSLESVAWHSSLDSFLVVTKDGLHLVSAIGERKTLLSTPERMMAASYSPGSRSLVWCSEDGMNCTTLRCANIESIDDIKWQHEIKTFDDYDGETGEAFCAARIVITPCTETILVGVERNLRRFSMSGKPLGGEISLSVSISGLAVARDETVIAIGGRLDKCYCYNWDGSFRFHRTSHQGGVMHLCYSNTGDYLYSGSLDSEIKCWDIAGVRERWQAQNGRYIIDGWGYAQDQFAVCKTDVVSSEAIILMLHSTTGQTVKKFTAGPSASWLKFARLGRVLVIIRASPMVLSRIEIWDPVSERMIAHRELTECQWSHLVAAEGLAVASDIHHLWLIRFEANTLKVSDMPLPGHGFQIKAVEILDSQSLIVATHMGTYIGNIHTKQWKQSKTIVDTPRFFSPVKAGKISVWYENSLVEVRDSTGLELLWSEKMAEVNHYVSATDLSPDGKQLAIGITDGTIQLIDLL
jgi:WD40 repeat protein